MQVYDFNVTNIGPQEIGAPGRYIKYLTGNATGADATLKVQGGRNGEYSILKPGQALTFSKGWNSFTVSAYVAGSTIVGQVVIGDGKMDDSTVQGTVQVVDGGKARAMNNSAFIGVAASPGLASQYPRIQLWNPAGSGVRLVLENIFNLGANTLETAILYDSTAACTSLNQNGLPKMLGGSQSVGQLRQDTTASVPAMNPSMGVLAPVTGGGAISTVYRPVEPVVIPPGHGFLMVGTLVADNITATFEWFEEPNV